MNIATKSKRCLTVGLADHLAGLQFDAVVIAGLGDAMINDRNEHRKIQFASRLYLGVSRSSREVQLVLGLAQSDYPELIKNAIDLGVLSLG